MMRIEELRQHPVFSELTDRQRTLVEIFLETGDREKAARAAYGDKSPARVLFAKPRVKRCLAVAAGEDSTLDELKSDLRKMMRSPKTTPSQIAAARLYAKLSGFVDSEPEPEGKIVADQVLERDGRKLRTVVTDVTEKQ